MVRMLENRHEQKGVLSQHIMIYLKYCLLSCENKSHIQCQFRNQLYIAQKISSNLTLVPPARWMAKIHLKVILLCPHFVFNCVPLSLRVEATTPRYQWWALILWPSCDPCKSFQVGLKWLYSGIKQKGEESMQWLARNTVI